VSQPVSVAAVDRIRRAWHVRAGGAVEQALFALLLAVLVGGAHLARIGTPLTRAAAGLGLVVVVAMQIGVAVRRRRDARSASRTLRRVLTATDPALGQRALRALSLLERTTSDASAGSSELATLHLTRVLERASSDSIGAAGARHAQRFRAAAVLLLCLASIAVLMGPQRIVEGLDVLAARHGRGPLTMTWLAFPRISAVPPAYTREPEHSLVLGIDVELPVGSVVTVRGVPRASDRALVVTDGTHEEPLADDGSGGLVARFTVRSDVTLRVAARFGDVRIDDDEGIGIHVVPDKKPTVELDSAPRVVRLADVERLDIRWEARDDHGLRQVDLVMRSGVREERRVLGRFDGETKVERGGRVVMARDAFLRRMFLPISITVEAKDNDPFEGPKWSSSAAIQVLPPEVGQPEAERYAAFAGIRDSLVDFLKGGATDGDAKPAERARLVKERLAELRTKVSASLDAAYSGASVPPGLTAFVEGQLDRLSKPKGNLDDDSTERAVLAVDVALSALGNRDATEVAKRLADVAEEVAVSAREARETEHRRSGLERLDAALDTLKKGAGRLGALAALGRDLGGVATADTGRVERARRAEDLTHVELAALHLAARLRRPNPSFGSSTSSHHGRGGESGAGNSRGGQSDLPSPSSADEEFDRAANSVAELAEQHENSVRGVESALDGAAQSEPTEAQRKEAKRLADGIREAVDPLPLPGQEFGSPRAAAALAREHAKAAAHALDDLSLQEAAESAENALDSLEQAEKRLGPDDPMHQDFGDARRAVKQGLDWARSELDRKRAEAESRAKGALEQAGDTERELAERAGQLGEGSKSGEAALPKEIAERLERAESVMQEAAKELAAGHGERALALQREAQRLLDQSRLDRAAESESDDEDERSRQARRDKEPRTPEPAGQNGDGISTGGEVPGPDDKARAEEFRRRVLEGLGRERSERLSPAVRRYAEGLLR
jgi:hypothetical protein